MSYVDTYEGIEIILNAKGRFEAKVNGKLESAASLSTMKQKIKAAHVGDVRGRVEGLQEPVGGSVEYGFRKPESYVILGVSSEKQGRGGYAKVVPVYVVEHTPDRYNRSETSTCTARGLVRPNPAAMAKLEKLHQDFVGIKAEMNKQAQDILDNEFEHVTVDEVRKMLEGKP